MWSIPELVLLILELLGRHDQASMAVVSQRLWKLAIPYVWASLSDVRGRTVAWNVRRQSHLFSILPSGLKSILGMGFDDDDLPVSGPRHD